MYALFCGRACDVALFSSPYVCVLSVCLLACLFVSLCLSLADVIGPSELGCQSGYTSRYACPCPIPRGKHVSHLPSLLDRRDLWDRDILTDPRPCRRTNRIFGLSIPQTLPTVLQLGNLHGPGNSAVLLYIVHFHYDAAAHRRTSHQTAFNISTAMCDKKPMPCVKI